MLCAVTCVTDSSINAHKRDKASFMYTLQQFGTAISTARKWSAASPFFVVFVCVLSISAFAHALCQ